MSQLGDVTERHRFDVDRLATHLAAHLAGFRGPLTVRQFHGGQSNPTYLLATPTARYSLQQDGLTEYRAGNFVYFEGHDEVIFEYSNSDRNIVGDLSNYRPRQFPLHPTSFCMWGSKPDIAEFRD